jgi:hypothetical protein
VKDTSPKVEALYHSMLMSRSGEERLKMACAMFDSARTIVIAGLRAEGCPEEELRAALFLRIYGADFKPETAARICARLRAPKKADRQP